MAAILSRSQCDFRKWSVTLVLQDEQTLDQIGQKINGSLNNIIVGKYDPQDVFHASEL